MKEYLSMQQEVLERGVPKGDRTGTGTISCPGVSRVYDISDNRLAATSTKKIHIKTGQVEEDWMLSGDTRLKFLKDNNCNIWDEWVLKGTGIYRNRTVKEMRRVYTRNHFGWSKPVVLDIGCDPENTEVWNKVAETEDFEVWAWDVTKGIGIKPHHGIRDKSKDSLNWMNWQNPEDPIWLQFYSALGISDLEVMDGELGKVYGAMFRSIEDTRIDSGGGVNEKEWTDRGFSWEGMLGDGRSVYTRKIDQVAKLLYDLEHNPDSRRLILCPWNPAYVDEQALPPCHSFIQFWTREMTSEQRYHVYCKQYDREQKELLDDIAKRSRADIYTAHAPYPLSCFAEVDDRGTFFDHYKLHAYLDELDVPRRALTCIVYMRSNDVFLGAPYNLTFYSSLTHKLAHQFNMYGEKLVHFVGDAHIYQNHLDQVAEQQARTPDRDMPRLKINVPKGTSILDMTFQDLEVIGYNPQPAIEAPVAV
jgi:thymidylate synthase